MKWRELLEGDVVFTGQVPVFVVLSPAPESGAFRWLSLMDANAGHVGTVNLRASGMWEEQISDAYDHVLRGDEEIKLVFRP